MEISYTTNIHRKFFKKVLAFIKNHFYICASDLRKIVMNKWKNVVFESSSRKTPEFISFSRDFKKFIKKQLAEYPNLKLETFSVGHFYISGFISNTKNNKIVYFNISDVRHFIGGWYKSVLYRTAEHLKDYTGGYNNTCELSELIANINELTK